MEVPQDVKPKSVTRSRKRRTHVKASKTRPLSCLEGLPLDTLMKVLSYLDAPMLFSLCHVSRFFNEVANNKCDLEPSPQWVHEGFSRILFTTNYTSGLWKSRYMADFGTNDKVNAMCSHELLLKMTTLEMQQIEDGFWRRQYFRTVAMCDMNKWKRHLRPISCYTGLPCKTEYIIRSLIHNWELTVSANFGYRTVLDVKWVRYSETSVTLCWSAEGSGPSYDQVTTLRLQGVRRVTFNCPGLDEPIWKSLIVKENVETLTPTARVIGQDGMVEMRLLRPGIAVGLWRENASQEQSIVFVICTLHFHRLVEKSIQGSSLCPYVEPVFKPPIDDVDPEYGLHNYQLHLVLHDSVSEIIAERFPLLFCRREEISDGFVQLTAIKESNLLEHKPLSNNIQLAWSCETLEGVMENCCIMNLTLLDEFKNPFWCVSSPIYIMEERKKTICYDYYGDQLQIHFKDTEGQVKMNFAWKEDLNQFYLMEAKRDVKPRVAKRPLRRRIIFQKASKTRPLSCIEKLPPDKLTKVMSYLDASMLFSLCHVNSFFRTAANDNDLWKSRYIADFGSNKKGRAKFSHELLLKMATLEVQEKAAGYWRRQYFRTVATCDMNLWKRHLRLIDCFTGLPRKTDYILRSLIQNWELTIVDNFRSRTIMAVNLVRYSETSVTLCWNAGGTSPTFNKIAIFNLHGVRRIPFNCPGLDEPIWKSLILRDDVENLINTAQVIGKDSMVEMRLIKPGILVGVWREKSLQIRSPFLFVMFTINFHRLVEKSIHGSSLSPYVPPMVKPAVDDIDPEYGLHDYQLHLLLHDSVSEIMSERFTLLSCKRADISDGFIKLTAIKESNLVQHKPLSGGIKLVWRCEALQGIMQNCCIMSLTLLDEFKNPFWCVSSPIHIMEEKKKTISYDYDGDQLQIHFKDTEGQVKMNLAWKEELNQLFLVM